MTNSSGPLLRRSDKAGVNRSKKIPHQSGIPIHLPVSYDKKGHKLHTQYKRAGCRTRTDNPLITSQVLYQLKLSRPATRGTKPQQLVTE